MLTQGRAAAELTEFAGDTAASGRDESIETTEQGRLACARETKQHGELTTPECNLGIAQGGHAAWVDDAQSVDPEHGVLYRVGCHMITFRNFTGRRIAVRNAEGKHFLLMHCFKMMTIQ